MFDSDEADVPPGDPSSSTPSLPPAKILRTCWSESTLISRLIQCLPSLNHISFFADASDDTTLALLFGSLIPHPSTFAIPPPTVPASPSAMSTMSFTENAASLAVYNGNSFQPVPLTSRLRSFGWRQRAPPPNEYRSFAQTSTFVSTLHLLRHAHRLSFLVLDADLDEMHQEDVIAACQELSLREPPIGEEAEKVSLMLCGPIRGWGNEFLAEMVKTFGGIKELFLDRPLRKSKVTHETTFESFVSVQQVCSTLSIDTFSPDDDRRAIVTTPLPPLTSSRLVYLFDTGTIIDRVPSRPGYTLFTGSRLTWRSGGHELVGNMAEMVNCSSHPQRAKLHPHWPIRRQRRARRDILRCRARHYDHATRRRAPETAGGNGQTARCRTRLGTRFEEEEEVGIYYGSFGSRARCASGTEVTEVKLKEK